MTGKRRDVCRWHRERRSHPARQLAEAIDRLRAQRIEDPRAAALTLDPASLAQHLEVMRHGRLADVAAGREVAGTHLGAVTQLAQDRESCRVGGGLEQQHVRIRLAFHPVTVLTNVYLDKYQYSEPIDRR